VNAPTRRALVRYLVSYAAAGGRSDYVERTQREIEEALAADDRRVEDLERRISTIETINGIAYPLAPAAGVTLNAEAAAALERDLALDDIAEDLVRQLFTNGQGNQAARLMLVDADGRELAGWGPGPVRDRVLEALRKVTAPAAILEAIQDQEAILRLALALRALGRNIEWDQAPTPYSMIWTLAEYLEKPEDAREAIVRADERNARMRRTR
jgi:hypothetical protein